MLWALFMLFLHLWASVEHGFVMQQVLNAVATAPPPPAACASCVPMSLGYPVLEHGFFGSAPAPLCLVKIHVLILRRCRLDICQGTF